MKEKIVNDDLLKVFIEKDGKREVLTVLAWGDSIKAGLKDGNKIPVKVLKRVTKADGFVEHKEHDAFVKSNAKFIDVEKNDIVKFSVVDVQQADGNVLETPKGKTILIDGGENQLFARYLASRYPNTSDSSPKEIDAIIVTHGDADHFKGLTEISKSEKHKTKSKRLFIYPKIVYHNGLVKKPGESGPTKIFGKVEKKNDKYFVTELKENLLNEDPAELNRPFKEWQKALSNWNKRKKKIDGADIIIERISDRANINKFDFLSSEGIKVKIYGPIEGEVNGNPALELLHKPLKKVPEPEGQAINENVLQSKSYSASHTINGHSIVLKIIYGKITLLLTGDLNEESEEQLVQKHNNKKINLRSIFLKAPHHGSADFSPSFIQKVKPVISTVSSGDENERVEYIHPRATLVGALGKYGRIPRPIIFITELVAFFKTIGWAKQVDKNGTAYGRNFFSFQKTSYGIVNFRFNKEKMLVFTHSGKRDLKEAYAVKVNNDNKVEFLDVKIA